MSTKELIGALEAAELLGLSRPGIHKRIRQGRLTPHATLGKRGTYVFERNEIERLAALEAAKK